MSRRFALALVELSGRPEGDTAPIYTGLKCGDDSPDVAVLNNRNILKELGPEELAGLGVVPAKRLGRWLPKAKI